MIQISGRPATWVHRTVLSRFVQIFEKLLILMYKETAASTAESGERDQNFVLCRVMIVRVVGSPFGNRFLVVDRLVSNQAVMKYSMTCVERRQKFLENICGTNSLFDGKVTTTTVAETPFGAFTIRDYTQALEK